MKQQPARQFQVAALIGGVVSLVGVAGISFDAMLMGSSEALRSTEQLSAVAAVVGMIVSSIALVFAWKSELRFAQRPDAYIIAGFGLGIPASLVLLHFLTIIQQLVF